VSAEEIRYVVASDGVIERVAGPWHDFARANGAPELNDPTGNELLGHVAGASTREVIQLLMDRTRMGGNSVEIPFRCDAPALRRFMKLRLEPGDGGRLEFRSWTEWTEPRAAVRLLDRAAPRSSELLRVCSWCKRVDAGGEWFEVEEAVARLRLFDAEKLPDITHAMCGACEARVFTALE